MLIFFEPAKIQFFFIQKYSFRIFILEVKIGFIRLIFLRLRNQNKTEAETALFVIRETCVTA